MSKRRKSVIDEFIALPDSEKERIVHQIESETPERRLARSRPLNAHERAQWQRFKKLGRPKIGKGAKTISLTVERDLLKRADAYAKQHGISRARLIARGIQVILGSAA
jgi:hypothetical protein